MKKALRFATALAAFAVVLVAGFQGSVLNAQTYTPRGHSGQYIHPRTGQPINNGRGEDCHQTVYYPATQPTQPVVYYAPTMDYYQFNNALAAIRNVSFESTRLTVARQILDNNLVTAEQMREIVESFTFESGKLEIAKYGFHRTIDPQNYYVVNSAFTFESSIRDLVNYTTYNR